MKKKRIYIFIFCIVFALLLALSPLIINRIFKHIYPIKYEEFVMKYSEKYNIEPSLIYAVIKTESGFDKNAKSNKNAVGLMQITEETFNWLIIKTPENDNNLSFEDIVDPENNIRLGTFLIKLNLEYYDDENTAICAYNAGRGKMDSWLSDIRYSKDGKKIDIVPYEETKNYLSKIMSVRKIYNQLYFDEGSVN